VVSAIGGLQLWWLITLSLPVQDVTAGNMNIAKGEILNHERNNTAD